MTAFAGVQFHKLFSASFPDFHLGACKDLPFVQCTIVNVFPLKPAALVIFFAAEVFPSDIGYFEISNIGRLGSLSWNWGFRCNLGQRGCFGCDLDGRSWNFWVNWRKWMEIEMIFFSVGESAIVVVGIRYGGIGNAQSVVELPHIWDAIVGGAGSQLLLGVLVGVKEGDIRWHGGTRAGQDWNQRKPSTESKQSNAMSTAWL